MTQPAYMTEQWFALLQSRCQGAVQARVAKQLGISGTALSMVLNGTGPYGLGNASTARFADRVVHTFGRYPCPHLSSEAGGEERVITADECRAYAHSPAPTGSPRAMQHWQACHQCPHKAASAPPTPREARPRAKTAPTAKETP